MHLYEKIAADINELIQKGTFRAGDRIPSVRQFSSSLNVSINTVMQAYSLLEDRRIIESRPQSGFYVRSRILELSETEPAKPVAEPATVTISTLCNDIMHNMMNRSLLPLGSAIPDVNNLLVDRLNQILSSAVKKHPADSVMYQMSPGYLPLRVQIAKRSIDAGITVSPDEVSITSGCVESVLLALRTVCRLGDTIAVESPFYFNFLQMIADLGLKALEIPSNPREGISIDALEYAISQSHISACLLITSFSNPNGSLMPDTKKKELVELLAKHEIPLIEDDIYGDLSFAHKRPFAAKSFDDKGLVIYCSSFSKTLAPGYRVGWNIAGRYQKEMERIKMIMNIAPSSPTQVALAEFLSIGGYDHHLRKIRRIHADNVARMREGVMRAFPEGTRMTDPSGGFVLWVELPEEIDAIKLYLHALESGISTVPGPLFSLSGKYKNHIRLSAARWDSEVEKGIIMLGEIALKLQQVSA